MSRQLVDSEINLRSLEKQFRGAKFGDLVLHHYKQLDSQGIVAAVQGTVEQLPEAARGFVEQWIDQFAPHGLKADFWRRDCAEVFTEIISAARQILKRRGLDATDEDVFNMFQLIVQNFAYSFYKHPSNRQFVQKALGQGYFKRLFG